MNLSLLHPTSRQPNCGAIWLKQREVPSLTSIWRPRLFAIFSGASERQGTNWPSRSSKLLNAVWAIETGWVVQLNGDETFGFCSTDIDMIALGFLSLWWCQQSCLFLLYSSSIRREEAVCSDIYWNAENRLVTPQSQHGKGS